jgi:DHA1 family multidrug resistance protein-like MFS transporter
MFGWTSNEHIHWIVPLIGSAIVIIGAFMTFQSFFNYLGMSFPRYLASVFASNNLCRSGMAGAFPLFGRAMYSNLGPSNFPVGWGCSVLGFITLAMVAIPVVLYKYGKQLRARSKYAS